MNKILHGDCLIKMKELADNSVDAIVTDPPYGLSFMGKVWDYDVPNVEVWAECLRVLKPGGYLLSFAGTRTQHRMACNIEDAGFEIKDLIFWCYGSGFPKSMRIGCKCQGGTIQYNNETSSLPDKEKMSDLQKEISLSQPIPVKEKQGLLGGVQGKTDLNKEERNKEKSTLNLQTLQEGFLPKMGGEVGSGVLFSPVQREDKISGIDGSQIQPNGAKVSGHRIKGGEKPSMEGRSNLLEETRELQTDKIRQVSARVSTNGEERRVHNGTPTIDGEEAKSFVDEDRSGSSYQSQSAGQQNRESNAFPEQQGTQAVRRICEVCEGVIGMEGFGSALKPAVEPITVARKPISERNLRLNVLKWGTGGINIDGSRVGTEENITRDCLGWASAEHEGYQRPSYKNAEKQVFGSTTGRFPANFIHDGSDEVVELFPNTKSGKHTEEELNRKAGGMFAGGIATDDNWYGDNGSASRFFYCAKASKAERNRGCEGLEEKMPEDAHFGRAEFTDLRMDNPVERKPSANFHPTVKPIALMEYLVKLVSKEGAVILDPFAGSGSTLIACKNLKRNYIGIEMEADYIKIAKARLSAVKVEPTLFA